MLPQLNFKPKAKPARRSSLTTLGTRRRGSTLVEFAAVLPVLLALLIGIMEFGWLVKNNLTIANAAREGSRNASLGKATTEIKTRVQNTASPLNVATSPGSVVITWSNDNGADNYPYTVADSGTSNTVLPGKLIRVTATARHQSLTGFFPFLRNRNITASAIMRRE